jgi:flagellar motor protein MotB
MKNSTIYVGLFLMAFALYANELNRKPVKRFITAAEMTDAIKASGADIAANPAINPTENSGETATADTNAKKNIRQFYEKCAEDSILKTAPDGFRLEIHANTVTMVFRGDEVYAFGDFSIQKAWHPVLDRIAELFQAEIAHGLKVQIKGYSDPENALERKTNEFGKSEFGLAYARAEWVGRYMESKLRVSLREFAELSAGSGARRIELIFQTK